MKDIDLLRRENIATLQRELGSAKALAELLERDESQVSQWKQGSKNSGTGRPRGMRSETARYIEERTGKARGWLDRDHAPQTPSITMVYPDGLTAPLRSWEHEKELPHGAQLFIPEIYVGQQRTSGDSQVTISLVTANALLFDADFIRADQLQPNKLGYVEATDETMAPTVAKGDRCIVDTSQTKVVDGRTFAIYYDGTTRLRRLFGVPGGGVRIETDNPRHQPINLSAADMAHVTILGRVCYRIGRGGL